MVVVAVRGLTVALDLVDVLDTTEALEDVLTMARTEGLACQIYTSWPVS